MESKAFTEEEKEALIAELVEFLRMPSVSAGNDDSESFRQCAGWVRDKLIQTGVEARLMETAGHPVVYGEIGSGERSLLLYGHYDVQPPEPLDLWESDPFEPTIRNGSLFARGVADDKGDVLARIQALRTYIEARGEPPFRIKFFIEGEEEVGSPNLTPFVHANRELLAADACLWEGALKDEGGRPAIFCGTKGMAYVELRARGATHDLHSMYGGISPNPAWRLVQALRTIKDERGELSVDGFEDTVDTPSEEDLEAISRVPFDERELHATRGVAALDRDLEGQDALRELLLRPTANIAGIQSGYTGPGSKTIVPSTAFVKMDFRLVSGQSPEETVKFLRAHLDRRGFEDVEIIDLHGVAVAKTPVGSPIVRTAVETWRDLGRDDAVVYPTIGGSGPTALIVSDLGIPTIMAGNVANANSRIHAPNESIRLDDYFETVGFFTRFFERFGDESGTNA